jgi:hypothetical protein
MSAGRAARVVCPKLLAVCAGVAAAGGIVALQITRKTRYPFGSRQRRACVTLRGEPQLGWRIESGSGRRSAAGQQRPRRPG